MPFLFTVSMDAEVGVLQDLLARDCEAIKETTMVNLRKSNVDLIKTDFTCLFYEIVLFCMDYVRVFVATWPC